MNFELCLRSNDIIILTYSRRTLAPFVEGGGGWLKEMGLRGGRGKAGLPNLLLAIIKYVYILTLFTISVDISCFKSC